MIFDQVLNDPTISRFQTEPWIGKNGERDATYFVRYLARYRKVFGTWSHTDPSNVSTRRVLFVPYCSRKVPVAVVFDWSESRHCQAHSWDWWHWPPALN